MSWIGSLFFAPRLHPATGAGTGEEGARGNNTGRAPGRRRQGGAPQAAGQGQTAQQVRPRRSVGPRSVPVLKSHQSSPSGRAFLPQHEQVYCCARCGAHITMHSSIVSKCFHGRTGRAFLLSSVVNVNVGDSEDRVLMTGVHTVADASCAVCAEAGVATVLGWFYLSAANPSQRYKEGKVVLERKHLTM